MKQEVEAFGKALVEHVRDEAIRSCDRDLNIGASSPVAVRWQKMIAESDPEKLVRLVISDAIDSALFYLLDAIDNDVIHLSYALPNGVTVDLTTEGLGEMGGWYMASGGWIARHSDERHIDDFTDLTER